MLNIHLHTTHNNQQRIGSLKRLAKQSFLLTCALLIVAPAIVFAATPQEPPTAQTFDDELSISLETPFYDPNSGACTQGSVGAQELEGHRLPASRGGAGSEERIDASGAIPSGGKVTFSKFAALGTEYQDYYITMRWRYAEWKWDGTSKSGPESAGWYGEKPRLVLVTNPSSGKSIVAAILESGPAPWTGTPGGKDDAKQHDIWEKASNGDGYVDGTPSGYLGRVAGFPPKAQEALALKQWMHGGVEAGGDGDELTFSWAPDQNAKPGPTASAAPGAGASTGGCEGIGADTNLSLKDVDTGPNPKVAVDEPKGCTGGAAVGTERLAKYVIKTFKTRNLGIYNCRNVRGGSTWSLHSEGRAFDAGLKVTDSDEKARGDSLFAWAIKNAAGIGAQEIIWNRQIWSPGRGLHAYTGTNPHTDHVHIGQNWAGAHAETALYKSGVL